MSNDLACYLGGGASDLLESPPYNTWRVERSVEDDLPERIVQYVFPERGLELRCDKSDRITTIFVTAGEWIEDEAIKNLFSSARFRVLETLGAPSKSGAGLRDPILGEYGAWDRFAEAGHVVHVEYRLDCDRVKGVTLMLDSAVP